LNTAESLELIPLDRPALVRLARRHPVTLAVTLADLALPPTRTARRSLTQLDAGTAPLWCMPFMIVSPSRSLAIGGCGFKGAPVEGRVEIYYGVSPNERARGVATTAVQRLIDLALAHGAAHVIAHIIDGNVGSATVLQRLGFARGVRFSDVDGADVVPYVLSVS
jgi:ribosomal-protein-alanine N-acetyltransferase